jgi:hypothetical protein
MSGFVKSGVVVTVRFGWGRSCSVWWGSERCGQVVMENK